MKRLWYRQDRQADSDQAGLRVPSAEERSKRLDDHIGGQDEEADRDHALGAVLRQLRAGTPGCEAPQHGSSGRRLDQAVESERDQGDRGGGNAGHDGDGELGRMPRDTAGCQLPGTVYQLSAFE